MNSHKPFPGPLAPLGTNAIIRSLSDPTHLGSHGSGALISYKSSRETHKHADDSNSDFKQALLAVDLACDKSKEVFTIDFEFKGLNNKTIVGLESALGKIQQQLKQKNLLDQHSDLLLLPELVLCSPGETKVVDLTAALESVDHILKNSAAMELLSRNTKYKIIMLNLHRYQLAIMQSLWHHLTTHYNNDKKEEELSAPTSGWRKFGIVILALLSPLIQNALGVLGIISFILTPFVPLPVKIAVSGLIAIIEGNAFYKKMSRMIKTKLGIPIEMEDFPQTLNDKLKVVPKINRFMLKEGHGPSSSSNLNDSLGQRPYIYTEDYAALKRLAIACNTHMQNMAASPDQMIFYEPSIRSKVIQGFRTLWNFVQYAANAYFSSFMLLTMVCGLSTGPAGWAVLTFGAFLFLGYIAFDYLFKGWEGLCPPNQTKLDLKTVKTNYESFQCEASVSFEERLKFKKYSKADGECSSPKAKKAQDSSSCTIETRNTIKDAMHIGLTTFVLPPPSTEPVELELEPKNLYALSNRAAVVAQQIPRGRDGLRGAITPGLRQRNK